MVAGPALCSGAMPLSRPCVFQISENLFETHAGAEAAFLQADAQQRHSQLLQAACHAREPNAQAAQAT